MTLKSSKRCLVVLGIFIVLGLAACTSAGPAATCPPSPECPKAECPPPAECPQAAVKDVPFVDAWLGSGHADTKAAAFTHWDEDDPKVIPADCAKCHSEGGMLDFLGVDGSAAGAVDKEAQIGSVVSCMTCHNAATMTLTSVVFPSGAEVKGLGREARCMQCHQGRASTPQVDEVLTKAGLSDDDTVSADLGFTNIHYFAAAATQYGAVAKGGYQYPDKAYDVKTDHVAGFNTCVGCHDSHSLQLKVESCQSCHKDVTDVESLKNIRWMGSLVDYDGDGDTTESVSSEISGLQEMLMKIIQAYAKEVTGTSVVYSAEAYPYFFLDANDNGAVDEGEGQFKAWTGRLLKAAYNYQTSIKDPGAFAHGGKYIIELLYDSIESLNEKVAEKVDLSQAHRIDAGHFAGSQEAFRHWDGEGGIVPGSCAKCHTGTGLPTVLKEGAVLSTPATNGLLCTTCHDDLTKFTRHAVEKVTFPSGAQLSMSLPDSNLCISCHQGRESKVSVDKAIAGLEPDKPSENLSFRNVHYFAAGATLFGSDAKGAYEFKDKEYLGQNKHVEAYSNCTQCHDTHKAEVKTPECKACHASEDVETFRSPGDTTDYDGDGDVTEGMAGEIQTLVEKLYSAIQNYASKTAGAAIVYNPNAYPYFFGDANGNGEVDADEKAYANWTPRLLTATYNYQVVMKDPGAFAHNGKYIVQILYDTLADLKADMKGLVRPK
jgi:hypothetical protein